MKIDMLTSTNAALTSEIDAIHFANSLYGARGKNVTIEARAEYNRRIERLEQIRAELRQFPESLESSISLT